MRAALHDELSARGFVVLRGEIDPVAITAEIDRAFVDGFRPHHSAVTLEQGSGSVTFQYVPMMCERTPISLGLLDRLADVTADLVGRPVLPGRAKGTKYFGDTAWHRDSEHDAASVGCVAYLEPLTSTNGALQVWPGSHLARHATVDDIVAQPTARWEVLETEPGDVVVFDEHLVHGSTGGVERSQWRVDFVIDPEDELERASVHRWFGQCIPDERDDPGYDADRYPSYGAHWQQRDRPWTSRLRELDVP